MNFDKVTTSVYFRNIFNNNRFLLSIVTRFFLFNIIVVYN